VFHTKISQTLRVAFPLVIALFAVQLVAKSDSTSLKKVRDEYPVALSKLKTTYKSLEAKGRLVQGDKEPLPDRGNLLQVSATGGQRKVVMQSFDSGSLKSQLMAETIFCIGRQASFTARKNLKQNRYMVSDLNARMEGNVNKPMDDSERGFSMFAGQYAYAPFSINGIDNSELFDQMKYRLTDATQFNLNGREVIRLYYRNMTGQENKENVTGEIDFDTARGWVVTRHKMTGSVKVANRPDVKKTDYTMTVSVEYEDEPDKFYKPRLVRVSSDFGKTTCVFDKFDFGCDKSDYEFTPEAYDLGNAMTTPAELGQSHLRYYIFGGALLALVAAWIAARKGIGQ